MSIPRTTAKVCPAMVIPGGLLAVGRTLGASCRRDADRTKLPGGCLYRLATFASIGPDRLRSTVHFLKATLNNTSLTTVQRCRSGTGNLILEDLFSLVLSQFKKYHPSGILKFNYLGILQSLKLRISMGKSFEFIVS